MCDGVRSGAGSAMRAGDELFATTSVDLPPVTIRLFNRLTTVDFEVKCYFNEICLIIKLVENLVREFSPPLLLFNLGTFLVII